MRKLATSIAAAAAAALLAGGVAAPVGAASSCDPQSSTEVYVACLEGENAQLREALSSQETKYATLYDTWVKLDLNYWTLVAQHRMQENLLAAERAQSAWWAEEARRQLNKANQKDSKIRNLRSKIVGLRDKVEYLTGV